MKTSLTIAGSDPSGWAGVQADLGAFAAFGVRGLSAITALTAQNGVRVKATLVTPAAFLTRQVAVLMEEFNINSVKVGMTGSSANVAAIGRLLRKKGLPNCVLDPVFRSTSGYPLLDKAGVAAIRRILPLAAVVTPNLAEAATLTGLKVRDVEEMELAASVIHSYGPAFVLVKGGHLKGAAVDVLYDGRGYNYFEAGRLRGGVPALHGTGCILSAAIAAGLAKGAPVEKAVMDAKAHINRVIEERGR
ncbi:MAG: bifunctional hydroxymethylpyrimidine kinase/phosphomethylpyrimidine kinase [Deltaproteobacteria bacterium]|nr:bifunctional hydroxymethylpyrimidine kinase/phosphomethylpyrimidine kinase [Deltaproteobacteria bacterium]